MAEVSFEWGEPTHPKANRYGYLTESPAWKDALRTLQANPGTWARVAVFAERHQASELLGMLNKGMVALPAGEWEWSSRATWRLGDGGPTPTRVGGHLYGRFIAAERGAEGASTASEGGSHG